MDKGLKKKSKMMKIINKNKILNKNKSIMMIKMNYYNN